MALHCCNFTEERTIEDAGYELYDFEPHYHGDDDDGGGGEAALEVPREFEEDSGRDVGDHDAADSEGEAEAIALYMNLIQKGIDPDDYDSGYGTEDESVIPQ